MGLFVLKAVRGAPANASASAGGGKQQQGLWGDRFSAGKSKINETQERTFALHLKSYCCRYAMDLASVCA